MNSNQMHLIGALLLAAGGTATASAADNVKLHPLKAYTVEYRLEGQQTGTEIFHLDDWGRRSATLVDSSMKVLGRSSQTRTRAVTKGDRITTYDLDKNTATTLTNPMYAPLIARLKGRDPKELGMEMIRAFGFTPTGERVTVAGEKCEFWSGQFGRTCFTADGITLQVESSMAGVTIRKVATRVKRGDPGPASVYAAAPGVKVQELPNLNDIMQRMKQRPGG